MQVERRALTCILSLIVTPSTSQKSPRLCIVCLSTCTYCYTLPSRVFCSVLWLGSLKIHECLLIHCLLPSFVISLLLLFRYCYRCVPPFGHLVLVHCSWDSREFSVRESLVGRHRHRRHPLPFVLSKKGRRRCRGWTREESSAICKSSKVFSWLGEIGMGSPGLNERGILWNTIINVWINVSLCKGILRIWVFFIVYKFSYTYILIHFMQN